MRFARSLFIPYTLCATLAACAGQSQSAAPPQSAASTTAASTSLDVTTPQSALERLLRAPQAKAEWFAPSFLEKIPLEKVQALLDQVRRPLGALREVNGSGDDYVATFEGGTAKTHAKVDDKGRFLGLFIESPQKTK